MLYWEVVLRFWSYWDMSGNTSKWLIDWISFVIKFIQLHEEGTSVHEDCRLETVELYSMWGDWVTKTQLFYEPGTTAFLYFLSTLEFDTRLTLLFPCLYWDILYIAKIAMIYDCVPSFYFLSVGVLCWVIFVNTKLKLCLEIPTRPLKN